MRILLDTNAYSAMMRGHEGVAERVRRAEQVLLSAVVAGELMFGFRRGSRYEKNMGELEAFLENHYVQFLPVTLTTADRFTRIAASLRQKERPIPTNDIWIAAQAMESGADMISFDPHFDSIDGLASIILSSS
jgi:tRNA(fMet)-specific endonuclease VapC